jgi:hypothetical protein
MAQQPADLLGHTLAAHQAQDQDFCFKKARAETHSFPYSKAEDS